MDRFALKEKLDQYEKLMRLDKPIGVLLLLWPTLWGLWIASNGYVSPSLLWIFVLGTLLMRSAGCVMNDYADRKFDGHVARTRNRPLVAGGVSEKEALVLAALLCLAAFGLVLFLHRTVIYLACVALFLAASYPYTKRFFAMPQAYLGVAFGFGIPMAFAAVSNAMPPIAWWLLLANIFWVIAYDTEYAMVDREDDLKIGIRTSAITFGRFDVAAIMFCYTVMLAVLIGIGVYKEFGLPYYSGLAVAALLIGYHYRLIRNRIREGCFKAFRHNNWVGLAIFAGIVAQLGWQRVKIISYISWPG